MSAWPYTPKIPPMALTCPEPLRSPPKPTTQGDAYGYRWLRESFLALRERGLGTEAAQAELGYMSPLFERWDRRYPHSDDCRHHLRVEPQVKEAFWGAFLAGAPLEAARRGAGVGRSTAYRWWQARYVALREDGISVRAAARQLRVPPERATAWDVERRRAGQRARRDRETAERRAVRDSARHAEELMRSRAPRSDVQPRDARYWELMRSGLTNAEASRILGMHRKTGARIRARHHHQTAPLPRCTACRAGICRCASGCRSADLMRLGYSMRAIAVELGRNPSTIKRELDRHRDSLGRYLPHAADHAAGEERRRPKEHKLIANPKPRSLVQRKLNRCWSQVRSAAGCGTPIPTTPRCCCVPRRCTGRFWCPVAKG